MTALIPGGLVQNARGEWVDANGNPVDLDKLPADVKALIGYDKPARKKAPAKKKKAPESDNG